MSDLKFEVRIEGDRVKAMHIRGKLEIIKFLNYEFKLDEKFFLIY